MENKQPESEPILCRKRKLIEELKEVSRIKKEERQKAEAELSEKELEALLPLLRKEQAIEASLSLATVEILRSSGYIVNDKTLVATYTVNISCASPTAIVAFEKFLNEQEWVLSFERPSGKRTYEIAAE